MVVVLPCVVEKSDSRIYSLLNQAYSQIARLHRPEMISANADDRDFSPVFPSGLRGIWSAPPFIICGGTEADTIGLGRTEVPSTAAADARPACMKLRRSTSGVAWDCSFCRR